MHTLSTELADLFARDISRVIQEIEAFPDTPSIWQTVPGVPNAAGTLALHLEGNLREFIGRQLGQIAFTRDRPLEFSARGVEKSELIARLEAVKVSIPPVIARLTDAQLGAHFPEEYMGKPIVNRQFLVHLLAHLNYHLGQVDYLRRVVTGKAAIDLAQL
ncbi:MAG: DinB family protein [Acidimicrobiia bacterium]|nr:DinB family protein [Acidimicrobiia bacterium]